MRGDGWVLSFPTGTAKLYSIMARQPHAGGVGHGGSGRGECGGRFSKRNESSSLPCKGDEVRACKDLKGNVFTIGSGSKEKGK
jgi:hypothetical protein